MPSLLYWYSIQIQADFLNRIGMKEWCSQEIGYCRIPEMNITAPLLPSPLPERAEVGD